MVDVKQKVVKEVEEFKMKVEVLKKDKKEKAILKIKDVSDTFMNTIRREILESVPTMAIEEVEFRENDSILYDEMLAHRLGLIPFTTDLKSYMLPTEEETKTGEYSARSSLKMILKAKGPCTVYASDIQTKDSKIKPVFPNTPLVKLNKGQKLEFEATAILGKGKDHMKFAPGLAYYYNISEFKQIKKLENADDIVKKCPEGIFKSKNGELIPQNEIDSDLWDSCLDFVPKGTIEIKDKDDEFIFCVESWGQLSTSEILTQACEEFSQTLDEFEKLI